MINTKRLRCLVGWLGMALPWLVLFLSLIFGYGFPDSISATYYLPPCITPFMIILGSAGILLVCYNGYERIDDITCTITGCCAFGICLFSCDLEDLIVHWGEAFNLTAVGTFQIPPQVSSILHNGFALAFFGLLAFNSLFLFTRTNGLVTPNKLRRNLIFRICGVGMIVSFLCIIPISIFNLWGGIWVVEAIALMFFGISWLTKANCYKWLFADK